MMSRSFDRRKAERLRDLQNEAEKDKSPKGFVDSHIQHLVDLVNLHEDYVTTSSCSGRISLFESESAVNPKQGRWLIISHDPLQPMEANGEPLSPAQQVWKALQDHPPPHQDSEAWFKMEPFILCVECRDQSSAAGLVQLALQSGYRESGIVIANHSPPPPPSRAADRSPGSDASSPRFTVTLRTSLRMELPLRIGPDTLTSVPVLERLIKVANTKMHTNAERYQRLFNTLKQAWNLSLEPSIEADETKASSEPGAEIQEAAAIHGVRLYETEFRHRGFELPATAIAALQGKLMQEGVWAIMVPRTECNQVKAKLDAAGIFDRRYGVWKLDIPIDILPEMDAKQFQKPHSMALAVTGVAAGVLCDPEQMKALGLGDEIRLAKILPPKFRSQALKPVSSSASSAAQEPPRKTPSDASADGPQERRQQSSGKKTSRSAADPNKSRRTPAAQIRSGLLQLLRTKGMDEEDATAAVASLMSEIPRHYKILGSACLLSPEAFRGEGWSRIFGAGPESIASWDELWSLVARVLGVSVLGQGARIAPDQVRSSQVRLLWPPSAVAAQDSDDPSEGPGWVTHRENSVVYRFDITKCMFSAGNVNEKQRMGKLAQPHETVVDLYAGIGYFTLPFLVHGRVAHVHACEINPHAVRGLRAGLEANRIPTVRYTIHEGDNRRDTLKQRIRDCAHRVSLGYLPHSEEGFSTALHSLRPEGGWLHIHANVSLGEEQKYLQQTILPLLETKVQEALAPSAPVPMHPSKKDWSFECTHISMVKSYAPKVRHLVYDIRCGPAEAVVGAAMVESKRMEEAVEAEETKKSLESIPPTVSSPSTGPGWEVPILRDVTGEHFWQHIVARQHPVVIRGVDMGRAPELWTWEYLRSHSGGQMLQRRVQIHETEDVRLDFLQRNYRLKSMAWGEFVERVQASPPATTEDEDRKALRYYLRSLSSGLAASQDSNDPEVSNFWRDYPTLSQDFQAPPFFSAQQPSPQTEQETSLFSSVLRLSSRDIQLWTHNDMVDNVLCHIRGRKRVILYPPGEAHNLYVPLQPNASTSPVVDVERTGRHAPDLIQYPRYRKAAENSVTFILEPGDCLFIPALWYHNVRTLEPSVSISLFWRSLPADLYPDRDVYGNKDLTPAVRAIQLGQELRSALDTLPEYYREFYTKRIVEELRPTEPGDLRER